MPSEAMHMHRGLHTRCWHRKEGDEGDARRQKSLNRNTLISPMKTLQSGDDLAGAILFQYVLILADKDNNKRWQR